MKQSVAFKQPNVARPSLLGLDKLAAAKKAEQAALNGDPAHPNKRFKADPEEDEATEGSSSGGVFKSMFNHFPIDSAWLITQSQVCL